MIARAPPVAGEIRILEMPGASEFALCVGERALLELFFGPAHPYPRVFDGRQLP